eukprot:Opistho-1_new@98086
MSYSVAPSGGLPLQDEFVVGLVDPAGQRDQVELQLAQVEVAPDALLDRGAPDHQGAGRVDLHHRRVLAHHRVRVVGLDGLDDRQGVVVGLQRDEDRLQARAGAGGAHALASPSRARRAPRAASAAASAPAPSVPSVASASSARAAFSALRQGVTQPWISARLASLSAAAVLTVASTHLAVSSCQRFMWSSTVASAGPWRCAMRASKCWKNSG